MTVVGFEESGCLGVSEMKIGDLFFFSALLSSFSQICLFLFLFFFVFLFFLFFSFFTDLFLNFFYFFLFLDLKENKKTGKKNK